MGTCPTPALAIYNSPVQSPSRKMENPAQCLRIAPPIGRIAPSQFGQRASGMDGDDSLARAFNAGSDARIAGRPMVAVHPYRGIEKLCSLWYMGWRHVDREWGILCKAAGAYYHFRRCRGMAKKTGGIVVTGEAGGKTVGPLEILRAAHCHA